MKEKNITGLGGHLSIPNVFIQANGPKEIKCSRFFNNEKTFRDRGSAFVMV